MSAMLDEGAPEPMETVPAVGSSAAAEGAAEPGEVESDVPAEREAGGGSELSSGERADASAEGGGAGEDLEMMRPRGADPESRRSQKRKARAAKCIPEWKALQKAKKRRPEAHQAKRRKRFELLEQQEAASAALGLPSVASIAAAAAAECADMSASPACAGGDSVEGEGQAANAKAAPPKISRAAKKAAELADFKARCEKGATVVLDMEWEDAMAEREIKSLIQQVMYCYGINRNAPRPVQLVLSGVRPGTKTAERLRKLSGFESWPVQVLECSYIDHFPREKLVYLTSDTEEVLHRFDPEAVYIIGGLVDHNRLKGVTRSKADEQNIRTAQLPLGEYIEMGASYSRVLAVNHVLQIVVEHQGCGDWRRVLERCVPGRKKFLEDAPAPAAEGAPPQAEAAGGAD